MRLRASFITLFLLFAIIPVIFAQNAARTNKSEAGNDSLQLRFPVSKTTADNIDNLQRHALDLKNPTNIVTDTLYNLKDSTYSLSTRLGDTPLGTPITLSSDEYSAWKFRQSLQNYFREKNKSEFENAGRGWILF